MKAEQIEVSIKMKLCCFSSNILPRGRNCFAAKTLGDAYWFIYLSSVFEKELIYILTFSNFLL